MTHPWFMVVRDGLYVAGPYAYRENAERFIQKFTPWSLSHARVEGWDIVPWDGESRGGAS